MKKYVANLLAASLLSLLSFAQNQLSSEQWRQDLKWLQQTIHEKYPNLFYNLSESQFDSAVASIDKKIESMDDVQMKVELSKLIAMFHIGHTAVRRQWGDGKDFTSWVHYLPVRFYLFNDGLFIKSIHQNYKQALGGKVTRIGNKSVDEALQLIRPVIPYENEQGYKNLLQYFLNCTEMLLSVGITDKANEVTVTYLKDGRENKIVLPAEAPAPANHHDGISIPASWVDAYDLFDKPNSVLWLKQPQKLRYFEYLPGSKTVYVRHSAVQNEPAETIETFFNNVFDFIDKNEVDRFILDIRLNGGGNNYLNKPVITGIIRTTKINRKGHLFVILGKATFSAAQNLTNELEKYTECIFVGEPTSENVNFFGDTKIEVLPNSQLSIALSWLWWQNLDPRDKRQWTAPRLATDMNFADYRNGADPAMNAIMKYSATNDFEAQVQNLLDRSKFDEALALARKYTSDPLYRYVNQDLENQINNYGYRLLNANNEKQARQVLFLNLQLFPASPNVYDSYAEACWKCGDIKEAVKYYELAVSKDPNGETGANSRRMLQQIKKDSN